MNKKGVVKSNAKPSRVKKEEPKDSEEDDEDDFKVLPWHCCLFSLV